MGFPDSDHAENHEEYFWALEDTEPPLCQLFDHMRIVCFASENTNLLMWSHYAHGLRGFCIGLDESLLAPEDDSAYLTDVEYLDSPPMVDAFVCAVADDQYDFNIQCIYDRPRNAAYFGPNSKSDGDYRAVADEAMATMRRRAFAAKPAEWGYEREKRLLVHHGAGGTDPLLLPYPVEAVAEIVVGEKMTSACRDELLAAAAGLPASVRFMEAYRSNDSFSLSLREVG